MAWGRGWRVSGLGKRMGSMWPGKESRSEWPGEEGVVSDLGTRV